MPLPYNRQYIDNLNASYLHAFDNRSSLPECDDTSEGIQLILQPFFKK
jgi:hypothetical protein